MTSSRLGTWCLQIASDRRMSTRRLKLAESSKKAAAARSKRLLEMSRKQMRDSQKNLGSNGSLNGGNNITASGRSLQLSEANVESGMVL